MKIDEAIDRAGRSNLAHVVTDCPTREKLGWLHGFYDFRIRNVERIPNLAKAYHPLSAPTDSKRSTTLLGSIVTLCHHNNAQPLAMKTYSGKKDDCELPIARRLLANKQLNLSNSVVTADALHCQKKRR